MAFLSPQENIWDASRRGDLEAVRRFGERDGFPDVEDDYDKQSLLTVACAAGHVEVVRYLLDQGCRSSYTVGRAPEAFAAMENGHLDVLRLLCEHGLDPDSTPYSKHGPFLLDEAIEQRRAAIVRLLLMYGGYIYSEYEDEATPEEHEDYDNFPSPIELAARAGDLEFVSFLLEVGVDLQGQTPDFYLLKAKQNELKHRRAQQDNVEKELRNRLISERANHEQGCLFWSYTVLGILGLVLCWIVYCVISSMEWWELSVLALCVLAACLNGRQK